MKQESFISKVIADGRVTIPKNLREQHSIAEGDFVEVQLIRKINMKNRGEEAPKQFSEPIEFAIKKKEAS